MEGVGCPVAGVPRSYENVLRVQGAFRPQGSGHARQRSNLHRSVNQLLSGNKNYNTIR